MHCELEGLDCPVCAQKIEDALNKELGRNEVRVNFPTATIRVPEQHIERARQVIARIEPGVRIRCPEDRGPERNGDAGVFRRHHLRVGLAVLAFAAGWLPRLVTALPAAWGTALFLLAFALAGYPVIAAALRGIGQKHVFDENVLMTLATVGALALGEYPEAAAVMVFFSVGETLQAAAVGKSRSAITSLMALRPESAHLLRDGVDKVVAVEDVSPGDLIAVYPGERIPLDGVITSGETSLDTSALTGESNPRPATIGDEVHAGSINGGGALQVRVIRGHDQSAVARILDLVQNAVERRAPVERFLTRFARWYTPGVVAVAGAVAILPPLLIAEQTFSTWIYRALVLLVISCPCALVVSVPLGYFAGIGLASRNGILVKGADVLDSLVFVRTVAMDKTGTLTDGRFAIRGIETEEGFTEDDILELAARAESRSNHPIAEAILRSAPNRVNDSGALEEIPGRGILLHLRDHRIAVGNPRLMEAEGIAVRSGGNTEVFVAVDGSLAGKIVLGETARAESRATLADLRAMGIERIVLLTGDVEQPTAKLAKSLGIEDYFWGLLPEDKVTHVENLRRGSNEPVLFAGDGINDAPVLAAADVGVALGGLGSDAALEAADLVIMEDRLERIPTALRIARLTRKRVLQNTAGALGLKAVFLTLAVLGLTGIWAAVFADVGVTILAVINSASLLRAGVSGRARKDLRTA